MTAVKVETIKYVEEWLLARRPELTAISLDLDLIENRVIDSLGFMEFLYFLEELVGCEIVFDAQSLNSFRTLRIIQENILPRVEP